MRVTVRTVVGRLAVPILLAVVVGSILAVPRAAVAMQPPTEAQAAPAARGGEVNLVLPDLSQVDFRGVNGRTLLMGGLGVCLLGLGFGLMVFTQTRNLPVHPAMRE